jgi:hypothetical protein
VRAHQRKDGGVIKFHFRGERQFVWAGYQVSITVPGRDHINIVDFNAGANDGYWIDDWDRDKYINKAELGKRFADDIKRGSGSY